MRYIHLIVGIFSVYILPAQQTRKVLDEKSGLPVSFVTVRILNSTGGTIGSAEGEFSMKITADDSVLFTCAGYNDLLVSGKNIGQNVYMSPRVIDLKEIIVVNPSSGSITIGNEKKIVRGDITFLPSPNENVHTEFAQKIILPDSARMFRIKKVFIPIKTKKCNGSILLRIYETDSLHGWPGREILNKHIEGSDMLIKKNILIIDIRSKNIFFDRKDSFFVSVSWLPGAFYKECRTALSLSKRSASQTYIRLFENNPFEWNSFSTKFKNDRGEEVQVKTFFAAEVELYK